MAEENTNTPTEEPKVDEPEAEAAKMKPSEALKEFRKTGHVPKGFVYRAGKMRRA